MKPIINILESGKILLDCLNGNEDFVEVDTKDVVFLRLIGNGTVQFLDMAFLLEKNSVFVDTLQSNEFFSVTELDNDKFLCQLNEKKVDLDWIFLGNIRNYKNLPDNTYPYFIGIQDTECQTFYINLDKVSFVKTHATDYEEINIAFHHSKNNKMVFYKSVSNSKYIRFYTYNYFSKNKKRICVDINHNFQIDEEFVKMIKQQINYPYRSKDKTIKDNLLHFWELIFPI